MPIKSVSSYQTETKWVIMSRALTHIHTDPHPAKKRSHSPTLTHTQPKKGHTHPHLAKKNINHPHPAKKRSHPPTPSEKKFIPTHTCPHPAKIRSFTPKFCRKSMEEKIFHYPLVNQIYQKLKKS